MFVEKFALMFQEVDFSAGPFIISPVRREAADHTSSLYDGNLRILSGLRGLQVDPWGFVLPLTPLVWAATLMALLGVLAVLHLLAFCLDSNKLGRSGWAVNSSFRCVRIILQQGES